MSWCVVCGMWELVYGVWYVGAGVWCVVCESWCATDCVMQREIFATEIIVSTLDESCQGYTLSLLYPGHCM